MIPQIMLLAKKRYAITFLCAFLMIFAWRTIKAKQILKLEEELGSNETKISET